MFEGLTPSGYVMLSAIGGAILIMLFPYIGDVIRRMNENSRKKRND